MDQVKKHIRLQQECSVPSPDQGEQEVVEVTKEYESTDNLPKEQFPAYATLDRCGV